MDVTNGNSRAGGGRPTTRLPRDACKVRIACELPRQGETLSSFLVNCTVENLGQSDFFSSEPYPVFLAYKWRRLDVDSSTFIEGSRTSLPGSLLPGETLTCPVAVTAPDETGQYLLIVTLVQEWCVWFDEIDPANAVSREVRIYGGNIVEKIERIKAEPTKWPAGAIPEIEAGIVISACGRLFQHLYANLRNIRQNGCALPIDVWHLPGEFTSKQVHFLADLANLVDAGETPFSGLSGEHEVHGFKAWMLAHSRFRKTLMLDVDCFPLRSLDAVFESNHACILWRDGPSNIFLDRINRIRRSLEIVAHPFEFESGQLYLDREKTGPRDAARLASALNMLGQKLYNYTYGDKESYALAFDLLEEPYVIAPAPAVHPPRLDGYIGGLLQPWLDGSALFYHVLREKENWWRFKTEWAPLRAEAEEAEALCR